MYGCCAPGCASKLALKMAALQKFLFKGLGYNGVQKLQKEYFQSSTKAQLYHVVVTIEEL